MSAMETQLREFDVIVIGGGIAGLLAAAFASRAGASVLLLEAAPEFGGRARTRNVAEYHFNQGAHGIYRGGFLDRALDDLGVIVTGNVPDLAAGFVVNDNQLHQAPFGAAGLASTSLLTDVEKGELVSVFRKLRDPARQTPPGLTADDALAALSQSSMIRSVVAALMRVTSYVHAPKVVDGSAILDQLRIGLTTSVLYLDGGWGTMIDQLQSACVKLGARLRSGARVASIEHGPVWRVLLANGAAITAGAIILAVDPAQANTLSPATRNLHCATEPIPARVACLDIGLARLPRPDILWALGVDRPLYFSVHSAAARLAPEGAALVHVMHYLEPGEKPDRDHIVGELEGLMDLTQPGWRDHERARQFLPVMPVITSIPLARAGGMNARPQVAIENVEGHFIAGDWVGPVGMLADAAAASGRSAGEAAAVFARQ